MLVQQADGGQITGRALGKEFGLPFFFDTLAALWCCADDWLDAGWNAFFIFFDADIEGFFAFLDALPNLAGFFPLSCQARMASAAWETPFRVQ